MSLFGDLGGESPSFSELEKAIETGLQNSLENGGKSQVESFLYELSLMAPESSKNSARYFTNFLFELMGYKGYVQENFLFLNCSAMGFEDSKSMIRILRFLGETTGLIKELGDETKLPLDGKDYRLYYYVLDKKLTKKLAHQKNSINVICEETKQYDVLFNQIDSMSELRNNGN